VQLDSICDYGDYGDYGGTLKKILIVDDDAQMRALIRTLFKREGFITADASDGLHALREFMISQPDIVILDHDMPLMTGIEALKEFKKIVPEIPVVMFTGSDDEGLKKEAIRAGAHDIIRKPAENEIIVAAVQRAMGVSCMPMSHHTE